MTRPPSALRRFSRDGRGLALVEFALIAPLLILFYVGMAEICQGLMAERRTHHATSAIGDLVAQAEQVTATEVDEVFAIAEVIFAPFTTTGRLKLRVSSVAVNPQGVAQVVWSENQGWSDRSPGSAVDLPQVAAAGGGSADFLGPGESAIMSEAEYSFVTPFSDLFVWLMNFVGDGSAADVGGFEYSSTHYLRPRRSEQVTCSTC
jgi:Flp pilus assembly protein TadG